MSIGQRLNKQWYVHTTEWYTQQEEQTNDTTVHFHNKINESQKVMPGKRIQA